MDVQLVAVWFAILAGTGHRPADLTQEQVFTAVMVIVAVVTALLRFTTRHEIAAAGRIARLKAAGDALAQFRFVSGC